MNQTPGTFVWYDLITSDVDGAVRFYGDVLGWGTEEFEPGNPYRMWTSAAGPLGGVTALSDETGRAEAAPHWMAHVSVDDVDTTAAKAAAIGGGIVVPPTDIPSVGRFAVIHDPHGAELSIFKGHSPTRPAALPAAGDMVWHELMAGNVEAALRFYAALFGWEKADALESPMGVYQMYRQGDRILGGMMSRPAGYPFAPHWLYYTCVTDLDAALERVKKAGGQVLHGPMDVPGGRVAQCFDPQKAQFAMFTGTEPAAA